MGNPRDDLGDVAGALVPVERPKTRNVSRREGSARSDSPVYTGPVATRIYSVVAIVTNAEGRYLAVSRKEDHADLGWPGGKIEAGETPEDATVRELREETALIVSRRALRSTFIAPDEEGRLCMAFDVLQYKGVPYSREGAWVGWVEAARLVDDRSTFSEYNRALFKHKGVTVVPPAPTRPEPVPSVRPSQRVLAQPEPSVEDALFELTGARGFPRGHITFIHGPGALSFCPTTFIIQPRFSFDQKDFAALTTTPILGIKTHLQKSVVPYNLFRYMHALGPRCSAAVVAVSLHRPPDDWESVSSNVIECLPLQPAEVKLTLAKGLAAPGKLVGSSVVVPKPLGLETTTDSHQALP